jgi:transposase-like protein
MTTTDVKADAAVAESDKPVEGGSAGQVGQDLIGPVGGPGPRETVITQAVSVRIGVPRDRDASFEPQIVRKRRRRLNGVEELVLSLSAKGLTRGEISAHLAEVYGASVCKQTISIITDKVVDAMAERQSRPLDSAYPVIFLDAIQVKIRDGQVANRPIHVSAREDLEITAGARSVLSRGGRP